MEDAYLREKDVLLVLISTDRLVSGKVVVLMVKYGIKHCLNVSALEIRSGMVDNVSDVQEVKFIKDQVASVLKVCSGMVVNVQQLIQAHVEACRTLSGIEVDVTANLDSTKKEDLVRAMDLSITVSVIDAT